MLACSYQTTRSDILKDSELLYFKKMTFLLLNSKEQRLFITFLFYISELRKYLNLVYDK